jgi:hypothetical protein
MCCDLEPDFYSVEHRRARKAYVCSECPDPIERGERYAHIAGKWDGYVDSLRMHERCHEWYVGLQDAMHAPGVDFCQCVAFGELSQVMRDYCIEVLGYDPASEEEADEAA